MGIGTDSAGLGSYFVGESSDPGWGASGEGCCCLLVVVVKVVGT